MESEHLHYCDLPQVRPPALPSGLQADHVEALAITSNKWLNGTPITYCFVQIGQFVWPDEQKEVVRWAFDTWKNVGIGLNFAETTDKKKATLLIGLMLGNGSWSYIGTGVLHNRSNGVNMNFGWDLTTPWGRATALHEVGHALGMPHEHQNPKSGIVWNEEKVLEYFSRSPNYWGEEKTRWNILRSLSMAEVEGSNWDSHSIMHYSFAAGLITAPKPYDIQGIPSNTQLSNEDKQWMRRFYPSQSNVVPLSLNTPSPVATKIATQSDFIFRPTETRAYQLEAAGDADLKIGLMEVNDGNILEVLDVKDDSATEDNAKITAELKAGKSYRIAARTHFSPKGVPPSIFIR